MGLYLSLDADTGNSEWDWGCFPRLAIANKKSCNTAYSFSPEVKVAPDALVQVGAKEFNQGFTENRTRCRDLPSTRALSKCLLNHETWVDRLSIIHDIDGLPCNLFREKNARFPFMGLGAFPGKRLAKKPSSLPLLITNFLHIFQGKKWRRRLANTERPPVSLVTAVIGSFDTAFYLAIA